MTIEITVPTLGESVTEATVAKWLKQPGDAIERDEPVVELETDKVTLEVPAPAAGTIGEIRAAEGTNVPVGAVLGTISDGVAVVSAVTSPRPNPPPLAGEGVSPEHPSPKNPPPQAGEGRVGAAGDSGATATLERAGPAVRKLV